MKIWSLHLLDNLNSCLMNLKNSGDSTGNETMTSAMPVQCSNQLSCEVTQLKIGQFVGLMFSCGRNVVWKKCYMKCGVLKSNEDKGRFPFDQIFRFEIPGILCDEWNSIFRFVGLTNPRSSCSKFRTKIRDQMEGSFTFVYLLWGCWTTLKLK